MIIDKGYNDGNNDDGDEDDIYPLGDVLVPRGRMCHPGDVPVPPGTRQFLPAKTGASPVDIHVPVGQGRPL